MSLKWLYKDLDVLGTFPDICDDKRMYPYRYMVQISSGDIIRKCYLGSTSIVKMHVKVGKYKVKIRIRDKLYIVMKVHKHIQVYEKVKYGDYDIKILDKGWIFCTPTWKIMNRWENIKTVDDLVKII